MTASAESWAIRLAASSVVCTTFVIVTMLVKRGDDEWGTALNALWIATLVVAVVASIIAPLAARRSSLGPGARAIVYAGSLPALLVVGFIAYFFIVVLPRLA